MKRLILLVLVHASAFGAVLSEQEILEGRKFVVPVRLSIQGSINRWPESTQNAYRGVIRKVFETLERYGQDYPGNNLFRWTGGRQALLMKEVHFYFGDGEAVSIPDLDGGVVKLPLIKTAAVRGGVVVQPGRPQHIHIAALSLDSFLYDLANGEPRQDGYVLATSALSGYLFGAIGEFLEHSIVDLTLSRQAMQQSVISGLQASIVEAVKFIDWQVAQPEFKTFPEIQQRYFLGQRQIILETAISRSWFAPRSQGCGRDVAFPN